MKTAEKKELREEKMFVAFEIKKRKKCYFQKSLKRVISPVYFLSQFLKTFERNKLSVIFLLIPKTKSNTF